VFMDDTPEDRQAIQAVIGTIDIYPLAKFDGTMKQHDWRKLPKLTLYDAQHFFVPNEIKRYSLGTKNRALKYDPDGSLTIYVQTESPPEAQRTNWLPAPRNADFSLFIRAYWPKSAVLDGAWTPPPVTKVN
jgi:hypothetical protein